MISFAHFSDVHSGYISGKKKDPNTKINLREQDGYNALQEVVKQICADEDILFVVDSGDLFHSPRPSIYTIVKTKEILDEFIIHEIPYYNIAGNHDSTDAVKDIPSNRTVNNPKLNINTFIEPYVIQEIPNTKVVLHMVSHHGYLEQQETMKNVKPIKGKFNILVSHGSVWDDNLGLMLHSESEPREVIIPESVLKLKWDYILLGHIHERGWVHSTDGLTDTANKKIFYGGSLIRRGFSDKVCKLGRGWTKWTIDDDYKTMTPQFFTIPQRPQYDEFVLCENKSIKEIEEDIYKIFKKIDLTETPILRISLVDLDHATKLLLNWKIFDEYTSQCLTFGVKVISKEELKLELSNNNFSFDLLDAFQEYWNEAETIFEESQRSIIKSTSDKFLKEGQNQVLSE